MLPVPRPRYGVARCTQRETIPNQSSEKGATLPVAHDLVSVGLLRGGVLQRRYFVGEKLDLFADRGIAVEHDHFPTFDAAATAMDAVAGFAQKLLRAHLDI